MDLQTNPKLKFNYRYMSEIFQGDEPVVYPPFKRKKLIDLIPSSETYVTVTQKVNNINSCDDTPLNFVKSSDANPNIKESSNTELSLSTSPKNSQIELVISNQLLNVKLETLRRLRPVIRKHLKKDFNFRSVLNNTCSSQLLVDDYDICEGIESTESMATYVMTLKIIGVIISKGYGSSKKIAKEDMAKNAVNILLNPFTKIVTEHGNLVLQIIDDHKTEVPVRDNIPPKVSSTNTSLQNEPLSSGHVFPLDPNLKRQFLIYYRTSDNELSAINILHNSAQFCKCPINFKFPKSMKFGLPICCEFFLLNQKICSAYGSKKLEVQEITARLAVDWLSSIVFTVKIKDIEGADASFTIPRDQMINVSVMSSPLSDNNVGCKMLKMMGWTGGGIGKDKNTGISEPIMAEGQIKFGQGLGYSREKESEIVLSKVKSLFKDYITSNTTIDLFFTSEFSIEERKVIHEIAHRMNLKSVSKGKGNERHLIISRKFQWHELLCYLQNVGGTTPKYDLMNPQDPRQKISEYVSINYVL